jgi:hypothetical protein
MEGAAREGPPTRERQERAKRTQGQGKKCGILLALPNIRVILYKSHHYALALFTNPARKASALMPGMDSAMT